MVLSESPGTAPELVEALTGAPLERLRAEFPRLIAAVWSDGAGTDLAAPAVRLLMEEPDLPGMERLPYLAVLLGLLAEAQPPELGAEVISLAGRRVGSFLQRWRDAPTGRPLSLALTYLLAHFPDARDRVLAVADGLPLDTGDRSRLDRALQRLDPAAPRIGRAFPSPAAWELDDAEREFDRGWIDALSPEEVRRHWDDDTETVLGHLGAKAYWAVLNDAAPAPVVAGAVPARTPSPRPAEAGIFARHEHAFRCPGCRGPLGFTDRAARCSICGAAYLLDHGVLDLTAGKGDGAERHGDWLFKLAEIPTMGFFYEAHARPNFLRLCGSNWGGEVTPAAEDEYIAGHVRPAAGPVLDLAAGAGRWTSVLADAVGADRVIALDLALPMLAALRGRLPEVPAVMSNARRLPFGDATLGAVLCWNALQAFPADAAAAIAEVGRCLRPGGTCTLLTYSDSPDPVYRYFVGRHHFPQHADGLRLFRPEEVDGWLADAGLRVRDRWEPGTFVILTAERAPR
ncbi:class I SAM-dependent methyltransferase [Actinomadura nitritigenes]|uniref:class I SAM-dependent methyltransferase n=1 Tax=Actinomadura nitritigenes TaxID=134602 RepID=UPI003D92BDA5